MGIDVVQEVDRVNNHSNSRTKGQPDGDRLLIKIEEQLLLLGHTSL